MSSLNCRYGINVSYREKSLKVFSQFRIINKLLAPTFFNSLRTDQQVGYVVNSYESRIREYPAISMVIISDNTDLQNLKEKKKHTHTHKNEFEGAKAKKKPESRQQG